MSQETVERARRVMEALSRGELAVMIGSADPQVEWRSFFAEDLRDAWEIVRADVDDVKGSGIETESPAGWMLKFCDGQLICFRACRDPEQALEAVGLRE
jgi:hypothetical protein